MDHAGTDPRAGGSAGTAVVAGRGIVRKSRSLRGDRSLAAKKVCAGRKKFRGCGVITGDGVLGFVDLVAICLAVYGRFHIDYQFRTRSHRPLPSQLARICVICEHYPA